MSPSLSLVKSGLALLLAAFLLILASQAGAATEAEYNLDRKRAPQENLLSLIFGSAPPLATERGILIIDAFSDQNGNGRRDPGETDLSGQLSCSLDGIDYTIPAFIPGLKYEGNYQLSCQGASFQPDLAQPDLFIGRRGAIIRLDIPCRKVAEGEIPPLLRETPKTN
ncbi:hypothetical protein JCM30471_07440 [Desulfuromonas carbonis]|uniref:hypothetical protein n=1 Tax=Desulfuromonas sp. DDH964 TaxID=1823759 RepID=UPI00078EB8D1|nr:hypothetical protein [Desulfuromonas sp. DDH964]AMV72260.1 hypothetical protein DBW_1907 [Desulfuromonas sp. DDH964]